MSLNFRKLASLLTSSLLVAGGLVGLAAAPANATPSTLDRVITLDNATNSDFTSFGNAVATVELSSGLPAGAPSSGKSLKVLKYWETWGGTNLPALVGDEFISAAGKHVRALVYTPAAGMVVKLEIGESPAVSSTNLGVNVTSAGGWEVMDFDFSSSGTYSESVNYSRATIFFNLGVGEGDLYLDPPTNQVRTDQGGPFYLDNVTYTTSAATVTTFDNATAGDFTAFGNAVQTVELSSGLPVGAPSSGKSLKVLKYWETYGGVNLPALSGTELISAADKHVKALVYTPAAGMIVKLEIGESPAVSGTNLQVNITSAGGWEVMDFDFSAPSSGTYNESVNYSRATIFFNFGVGEQALYVGDPQDNVRTDQGGPFYLDNVTYTSHTTAPPVNYDVRLVSTQKNTATDTDQWVDCNGGSWCANNNYYLKMISAGASTTLNYVVTQHGTTTPVSGAVVRLKMNTGYSGSNATWSTSQAGSGSTFGAVSTSNPNDAGYIEATSNAQGEVSFTFSNTNTSGEAPRLLNVANPYPAGCKSPAGQTKASLQPSIQSVTGATLGSQYVDVVWPHITSSTINPSVAFGSDGTGCNFSGVVELETGNKGAYPHIRLEKQFIENSFDASWWDGVYQYRDADTKAYLKYIPVGSTFKLTYLVTDANNKPLANAPVSLIVNANYACAKTFFLYENSLIGPDDCAGGGQTELEPKKTDKQGRVTFVLTNTNETGEAMPADLNGLPNGKELGTNIKPHLVGATTEGIDMLFAHFVEPVEAAKVSAPAEKTLKAGQTHSTTFTFTDEKGAPIAATDVSYYVNGFNSKIGFAKTNGAGQVTILSSNFSEAGGTQTVAVSLARSGKLPLTATSTVNWTSSALALAVSGGKNSLSVKVTNANGKTVKVNIGGTTYTRKATSDSATFKFAATAGKKKVIVSVGAKSTTKTVTISN